MDSLAPLITGLGDFKTQLFAGAGDLLLLFARRLQAAVFVAGCMLFTHCAGHQRPQAPVRPRPPGCAAAAPLESFSLPSGTARRWPSPSSSRWVYWPAGAAARRA